MKTKLKLEDLLKIKARNYYKKKNPTKLQLIKLKALWMMNGDYIEFYI